MWDSLVCKRLISCTQCMRYRLSQKHSKEVDLEEKKRRPQLVRHIILNMKVIDQYTVNVNPSLFSKNMCTQLAVSEGRCQKYNFLEKSNLLLQCTIDFKTHIHLLTMKKKKKESSTKDKVDKTKFGFIILQLNVAKLTMCLLHNFPLQTNLRSY